VKASTEAFQLSVYPNPFADVVNIETYKMNEAKKYYVSITDIQGKEVIKNRPLTTNSSYQIKTGNLASGQYFVCIMEGSKILITQKIIKE
jgi:hypothetical protein